MFILLINFLLFIFSIKDLHAICLTILSILGDINQHGFIVKACFNVEYNYRSLTANILYLAFTSTCKL